MNEIVKRAWNHKRGKIRLFISQPFTGYDVSQIRKQRELLHDVFAQYCGCGKDDIILLDQLDPKDSYDAEKNFCNEENREAYRFCRSIGIMKDADCVIFFGDWRGSRGCKLEKEICDKYKIPTFDQYKLLNWITRSNIHDKEKVLKELFEYNYRINGIATSNPYCMDDVIYVSTKLKEKGMYEGRMVVVTRSPVVDKKQIKRLKVHLMDFEDDYLDFVVSPKTSIDLKMDFGYDRILVTGMSKF